MRVIEDFQKLLTKFRIPDESEPADDSKVYSNCFLKKGALLQTRKKVRENCYIPLEVHRKYFEAANLKCLESKLLDTEPYGDGSDIFV